MVVLRTLLTLWLCLTLPYTALASALRDPRCLQGHAVSGDIHSIGMPASAPMDMAMGMAMDAMPGMDHDHSMPAMPEQTAASSYPHAAHHCGCLLGCACVQACAAPACHSGFAGRTGLALTTLTQESPAAPSSSQRRSAFPAEVFRPPARRS